MSIISSFVGSGGNYSRSNDPVPVFSSNFYVWGSNQYGQLGTGDTVDVSPENRVLLDTNVTDFDAVSDSTVGPGAYQYAHCHYCKTDGSTYCMGTAPSGELGISDTQKLTPYQLPIYAKYVYTKGIYSKLAASDSVIYKWGGGWPILTLAYNTFLGGSDNLFTTPLRDYIISGDTIEPQNVMVRNRLNVRSGNVFKMQTYTRSYSTGVSSGKPVYSTFTYQVEDYRGSHFILNGKIYKIWFELEWGGIIQGIEYYNILDHGVDELVMTKNDWKCFASDVNKFGTSAGTAYDSNNELYTIDLNTGDYNRTIINGLYIDRLVTVNDIGVTSYYALGTPV